MIDIHPNFAAVKQGLIPAHPAGEAQAREGWPRCHPRHLPLCEDRLCLDRGDDFERLKWYGVYRQKPKDSGYFMMRTKIPGGQLNAAQARVLSRITDQFGHGFCDITTRQTIQMHWLRIEDFPEIFAELDSVGITTSGACGDDTRNVVGCPVAGIDPDEIIDSTPQMLEVNANMTNNRDFSNLPRKYKISVSGCCIRCAQPDINCCSRLRREAAAMRRATASWSAAAFPRRRTWRRSSRSSSSRSRSGRW